MVLLIPVFALIILLAASVWFAKGAFLALRLVWLVASPPFRLLAKRA